MGCWRNDNYLLGGIVRDIRRAYLAGVVGSVVGNQNCMFCSWCAEARLRGIDVLPRPVYSPRDVAMLLSPFSVFARPRILSFVSFSGLARHLLLFPGSRFYAHLSWGGSGGHEVLLCELFGRVWLADAQQGIFAPASESDYFARADFGNSRFARVDCLKLDTKVFRFNRLGYLTEWDNRKDSLFMLENGMMGRSDADYAVAQGWLTQKEVSGFWQ